MEQSAMISQSGASLLATLFPIGLLIVAVEARALKRPPRPTTRSRLRIRQRSPYWNQILSWENAWQTVVAISVALQLVATAICVYFVCRNQAIPAGPSFYIWAAGIVALVSTFSVLGRLINPAALREGE